MKREFRRYFVVALGVIAASCATVGKDFDRTHVHNIKPKVHDKAQITAWFGNPAQITTVAGGGGCNEMWLYQHARATHAGARAKSAALAVVFDQQGVVCESSYSEQNR